MTGTAPTYNLADLFELVVDTVPDRLALVAGEVRQTYRELDERASRFAHALDGLGVGPGQHVGILAYNRAEWVEAMVGCYKARAVPVNLNYRYVAKELAYVIDNADLTVLVHERELGPLVTDAVALVDADADAGTGSGTAAAVRLVAVEDGSDVTVGSATLRYGELLDRAAADRPDPGRTPDDLYVLYTGGTTGMPKGVLWRHEDIFFAAMGGNGWAGDPVTSPEGILARIPADDDGRSVMLIVGPLMHGNAQWGLWNALLIGGTAVLYTGHSYDPRALWRLVTDERAVSLALVGDAMARPLVQALTEVEPGTYDTSSLFVIASGGAMLSASVKAELASLLPGTVVMDRFGSSESGAQGAVATGGTGPKFTMGTDTSVLDDDLRPLTPGDGRIGRLARTGRIPLGYYKDEAKTAATFPTDPDGVRWSVPGDLASVEADGSITVHGRGSASINSGGEKIFPEEVEAAVKAHPSVFDAIVVGIPDERFGERVAVAVQPRPGATAPDLDGLQVHCRDHMAGYKVPRELIVVDAIPLTAAGKPDAKAAKLLF